MSTPLRYTTLALLAAVLGAIATYLALPPVIAPVSVDVHVPDAVNVRVPLADILAASNAAGGPSGVLVAGGSDTQVSQGKSRPGPARRLAYSLCRSRVSAELQRTGYAAAGGDMTPLKRADADAVAAKLTDGMIDAAGGVYGAPFADTTGPGAGDDVGKEPGPLLAFVLGVLEWLRDNPEFIRFLLSLLMLL